MFLSPDLHYRHPAGDPTEMKGELDRWVEARLGEEENLIRFSSWDSD